MLKGYIQCAQLGKFLLSYINFELSKPDMLKVAMHLRNCPLCMEKYTKIQARKKKIKEMLINLEKNFRMQREISLYIDKEASGKVISIVNRMILTDESYRKEFMWQEKLKNILLICKNRMLEGAPAYITKKVMNNNKKILIEKISPF